MFGVESEYAIAGIKGSEPMSQEELVSQFVRAAHRRLAHVQDRCSSSGMFLENGARFYIDCGLHPELTTPECTTPWELARYIKAGERIMEGLSGAVQAEAGPAAEIMCFRCNVDYSGSGSTWGCHESYLHRANPGSLPDQLIPHLVTRVVYTGAGGFHPTMNRLEFCVAPRLMHIQQVISGDSTGNRGIFHTRNESLSSDGYNRLHILCGESLCSETAIVLKIGATALVTAMAEQGLIPVAELRLAAPLDALHAVSADATCKRRLRMTAGGTASAIEIQLRYLQLAERHRDVLPPWADAICALWRRILDQLEVAPDSVATILDWAIKHRLFHDRAERRGFPAERLAFLNAILRRLEGALTDAGIRNNDVPFRVLLGPESPITAQVARIGDALAAVRMGWDDVEQFHRLRDEFYQIDTRFGQIGPRGIFSELDRRGVLDHRVSGVDGVEAAMREPPAEGRAKLRGDAVRSLSGKRSARCTWQTVTAADGRTLDLSDPFANAEVWKGPSEPPSETGQTPLDFSPDGPLSEPIARMFEAITMRRRYGRSRARAEGSPEATEGPGR
jgi:proteasome accessory factor A